jgi:formylglycine-generating enzyme required for sulfatase activity
MTVGTAADAPRSASPWMLGARGRRAWLLLAAVGVALGAGSARTTDAAGGAALDDVQMVEVPAGSFVMGSGDADADQDEQPVARIFVDTFWIDKVEVTNRRYQRCVEAGACAIPVGGDLTDQARAEYPVTILSWRQAADYCRWAGKRLPTEAEWEKAARGPDSRRYPWGNAFEPERANAGYTLGLGPVGEHAAGASPYGVLDMAGSVWEWTSSLYRPYPYDAADGREDLAARGARVNRGGSWYYQAWYVRTTYRATADQGYRRVRDLGARCARS